MDYSVSFPTGITKYIFQNSFETLRTLYQAEYCIVITDANIATLYPSITTNFKTIVIQPGEKNKNGETVEFITQQLLQLETHKRSAIIGIGGGVVTDITGFVASVYMRGVPFGFVPSTLLGMVDASIGGKNGINFGLNKNLLGCIRQPEFILFDTDFLKTLPDDEWSNGFAEIIKYACLFDTEMFEELRYNNIDFYKHNSQALSTLIAKCVDWKNKIVLEDEKESGNRKLLNFGHTLGHAIENLYHLPHGHAVALGMIAACMISEKIVQAPAYMKEQVIYILRQYNLPVGLNFDTKKVMELLKMDKKRNEEAIDYILLKDIAVPVIQKLSFETIEQTVEAFLYAGKH